MNEHELREADKEYNAGCVKADTHASRAWAMVEDEATLPSFDKKLMSEAFSEADGVVLQTFLNACILNDCGLILSAARALGSQVVQYQLNHFERFLGEKL